MLSILPPFFATLVGYTLLFKAVVMGDNGLFLEQNPDVPVPKATSAAENFNPTVAANPLSEAVGRKVLSTAFVMVGPGDYLTVELRNGRVLILRDVLMRPNTYCGGQISDRLPYKQFCGSYADVMTARPGGTPIKHESGSAVRNPAPASDV